MTVTDAERRCVIPGPIFTGNTAELISRSSLLIAAESYSQILKKENKKGNSLFVCGHGQRESGCWNRKKGGAVMRHLTMICAINHAQTQTGAYESVAMLAAL